jgi:hypothetical protein
MWYVRMCPRMVYKKNKDMVSPSNRHELTYLSPLCFLLFPPTQADHKRQSHVDQWNSIRKLDRLVGMMVGPFIDFHNFTDPGCRNKQS